MIEGGLNVRISGLVVVVVVVVVVVGYTWAQCTYKSMIEDGLHVRINTQYTQHNPAHRLPPHNPRHTNRQVGINSDDPSVFDSDLSHEYAIATEKIELSDAQVDKCTASAIEAAFIGETEKSWLRELVAMYQ